MKLARFCFVAMTVLFSSLAGAQNASTAVNKPGSEDGTIVNNTYANEYLGFSYPIPEGWQVSNDTVGNNGQVKAVRFSGGGLVLLVIDQHTGAPLFNRIVLSALDARSLSVDTQGFVSKFVRAQLGREGMELVRDTFPADFAGKHFFREDYKESSTGGGLYKAFVCTKFRGYFLGWTLATGSPPELEEAVKSLQHLSFGADEPSSTAEANGVVEMVPGSHPTGATGGVIGGVIGSVTQSSSSGRPLRVRVSQGVSQSLLIKKVNPQYPDDARQGRIQGLVVLKAQIDTNGDVEELTLVSGHPLLAPAALEAVKQWKYKPYLLNGQPVNVETQVTVAFQLAAQ
jgi:TonB family protein